MTANIELGDGGTLRRCLVVRLDDSEYIITVPSHGDSVLEASILYSVVPSFWDWSKLWWKQLRAIRRGGQKDVKAGIYVLA